MRNFFKGRIERWNDQKGFGFIRSSSHQGPDVFIHVSALKNAGRRPVAGDIVFYQLDVDTDGRSRAINARIEALPTDKSRTPIGRKPESRLSRWLASAIGLLLLASFGFYFYGNRLPQLFHASKTSYQQSPDNSKDHERVLAEAFQRRISNIQVEGEGKVLKLLPDDLAGSKHQKFIVAINSDQTVLIANNIDLASKINDLQVGDHIAFSGEYEWNEKGGVIHWTHHDPNGKHKAGWLRHNGLIYQ